MLRYRKQFVVTVCTHPTVFLQYVSVCIAAVCLSNHGDKLTLVAVALTYGDVWKR
jgi:hypothetical protein